MRYWPSQFLPTSWYYSVPGIILTAMNELNLGTLAIFASGYSGTVIILMFSLLSFWIISLTEKMTELHGRFFDSRYDFTPFLQYRTLLLLNRVGNSCTGSHLLPFMMGSACLVQIFLISSLLKFIHKLPFGVIINFAVGAGAILYALKLVCHEGSMLLNKSQELKQYYALEANTHSKKFVRSCRDMRVYAGTFFYTKSSTFATCSKLVLDQIITMLLSF